MYTFKKNKIFFKLLNIFIVGFFIVGFSEAFAQTIGGNEATCRMTILSMEANPTTIDTKTSVNFHAKVDRKGCAQNLDILFEFYTNADGNYRKTKVCIDNPPHQDLIEFDCPYDFSQYQYWDKVSSPGSLPYYMSIYSSAGHSYGSTLDWGKKFNVAKGTLGEGFTFIVEPSNPAMGGNLTIKYQDFPPGATGKIFVNDESHFVNIFSGGNSIAINSENGFNLGSNSVRIVLYNSSGSKFYDSPYTLTVAQTAAPSSGGNSWGCRAANGVYACTNNQNDTNLKQACGTYFTQQPSDKCGCTDAEYSAQVKGSNCKANGGTGKPSASGGGAQPGAGTPNTTVSEFLYNPLPVDSLTGTLLYIAKGFLAIVGLWGVVFIMIGGFKLVMAQGNEEAYLAAKKTITWAVLGVVVALLSFSIIAILQNLIGATVPPVPGGENPIIRNTQK